MSPYIKTARTQFDLSPLNLLSKYQAVAEIIRPPGCLARQERAAPESTETGGVI